MSTIALGDPHFSGSGRDEYRFLLPGKTLSAMIRQHAEKNLERTQPTKQKKQS